MNVTSGTPETGLLLVKYIFALIGSCLWIYYLIFWNSRLWGFVLTAILRRLAQTKDIAVGESRVDVAVSREMEYDASVGSVAISVLTGKIVFRDFRYVTANYSIRYTVKNDFGKFSHARALTVFRAVDGLIWYRWWIPTPRNNNYIISETLVRERFQRKK